MSQIPGLPVSSKSDLILGAPLCSVTDWEQTGEVCPQHDQHGGSKGGGCWSCQSCSPQLVLLKEDLSRATIWQPLICIPCSSQCHHSINLYNVFDWKFVMKYFHNLSQWWIDFNCTSSEQFNQPTQYLNYLFEKYFISTV